MNVTFMIGNGFDLRLGLKTRFSDMYKGYVATETANSNIQKLKEIIKNDEQSDYMTWGDFEMAMAGYAQNFSNESDFVKCVRDFKRYMAEHLRGEQQSFFDYLNKFKSSDATCAQEMHKSLLGYYYGQIPNVVNEIREIEKGEYIDYSFISFNYTYTLDYLLDCYDKYYNKNFSNSIVHIHGSLDKDIVLGIDNISQLRGLKFNISEKTERAFVKPSYNAKFDISRIKDAEYFIETSNIICIYGMSLGESDESWVTKLREWLLLDSDHHLFYYVYSEYSFSDWNSDEKMDEEDERKQVLLDRLFGSKEVAEQVYEQVHIPVGYDIFDILNKFRPTDIV